MKAHPLSDKCPCVLHATLFTERSRVWAVIQNQHQMHQARECERELLEIADALEMHARNLRAAAQNFAIDMGNRR